jgi:hypothetical protein
MRFILAANINYVTWKLFSVVHVRDPKLPLRCALKLIGYEDPVDLVGAYQYSISPRLRFK